MNIGLAISLPASRNGAGVSVTRRAVRPLDGINQTTTLAYTAGDEIILDIFPLAGNSGLPGGCPALVNNVIERVTFIATDSGVIGNNGAAYYSGIVFRCVINGVIYPLNDRDNSLRNNSAEAAALWINDPATLTLTLNGATGDWINSATETPYPLSELMAAIYAYGETRLFISSELLHALVHGDWQ